MVKLRRGESANSWGLRSRRRNCMRILGRLGFETSCKGAECCVKLPIVALDVER